MTLAEYKRDYPEFYHFMIREFPTAMFAKWPKYFELYMLREKQI